MKDAGCGPYLILGAVAHIFFGEFPGNMIMLCLGIIFVWAVRARFWSGQWQIATLFAGEGDEHLVAAVGAPHAGEPPPQVAALEVFADGPTDHRPPEPVVALEAVRIDPLELLVMICHDAVEG